MGTLPVTTDCYAQRFAALQRELRAILDQLALAPCASDELQRIEAQVQPIYAAIWAMHSEISL
jgi:hypothetical protein